MKLFSPSNVETFRHTIYGLFPLRVAMRRSLHLWKNYHQGKSPNTKELCHRRPTYNETDSTEGEILFSALQKGRVFLCSFPIVLLVLNSCFPLYAQVCDTASFPSSIGTNRELLIAADNIQTSLTSTQLFSDTTAAVKSSAGWMPNMLATIGIEQELVTGVVGNTLIVVRGQAGTQPIQHPAQSLVSNFIDACYNNIKTAHLIAIETALGPNLTNVIGAHAYVTAATSPAGQVITPGIHRQGLNASGKCFAGPVVTDTDGTLVASGAEVICRVTPDGFGNLTFQWISGDVLSLMVSASGVGPVGPQGASGLGASPYVANATGSGMSIPESLHGQGPNVTVGCWSGPLVLVAGVWGISGIPTACIPNLDGAGNLVVNYSGSIGSVIVSASGTPAAFTINATGTPMSIPQSTHMKGINPTIDAWTGALSGSGVTGSKAYPEIDVDASGNITVVYAGTTVGSVRVQ